MRFVAKDISLTATTLHVKDEAIMLHTITRVTLAPDRRGPLAAMAAGALLAITGAGLVIGAGLARLGLVLAGIALLILAAGELWYVRKKTPLVLAVTSSDGATRRIQGAPRDLERLGALVGGRLQHAVP